LMATTGFVIAKRHFQVFTLHFPRQNDYDFHSRSVWILSTGFLRHSRMCRFTIEEASADVQTASNRKHDHCNNNKDRKNNNNNGFTNGGTMGDPRLGYLDTLSSPMQFALLGSGVFFFFGIHNILQEAMMKVPGFNFGVMLGYMEVIG
jgi:hypothetical protein